MAASQKVESWKHRLAGFPDPFSTLVPNRAALWSGWRSASEPAEIARRRGLITLEMTPLGAALDSGLLKQQLNADFGNDFTEDKRAVWNAVSEMYARAVRGNLTVLLNFERFGNAATILSNANPQSIVFSEILETDFGDPRLALPLVTDIYVWVMNGDQIANATMLFSGPLQ